MTTDPIHLIELRNVTKTYAGAGVPVQVLKDVSLTIDSGEFVAIIGPSGSGKSTLMNVLGCIDRPTSGSYKFSGREVAAFSSSELAILRRDTFGFVFQQYHLVSGLTAAENVELPALYRGVSKAGRRARGEELLDKLGLGARREHRPDQLSGGQQQRVSIARALMNGGRVLLADEPTGALDRTSGEEVMAIMHKLSAAGHTIILITHDRNVARQARRTIEIADGRIISDSGRDLGAVARPAPTSFASFTLHDAHETSARDAVINSIRETARAAARALRANVGRTLLTLLGIMIGVSSVVALLGIGEGATRAVVAQLAAFGANRLYVTPVQATDTKIHGRLKPSDIELVRALPHVSAAIPHQTGQVVARVGNYERRAMAVGATSEFPFVNNWKTQSGVFFEPHDEMTFACVAVIGQKVAKQLFRGKNPLREYLLINNIPFQVIGVLEGKGALTGEADDDNTIVVPYSTGSMRIFGNPSASFISVALDGPEHASEIVKTVRALLAKEHGAQDIEVYNQVAAAKAQLATVEVMASMLLLTAIISLVVGGIGVMNVMLMTVVERTNEIGIRVAVGASQRDVLTQFLTEAVVLSGLGGILGLLSGWGVGVLIRHLGDQQVVFTPQASGLAFLCAIATGLLSGLLPARRAARMDPVVALAHR